MRLSLRKKRILEIFESLYPEPKSELRFKNEYQLLVAVMLSAQSTDKKVNELTPALFQRFPTFKKLAKAELEEVESYIRAINYYKTKARNLIAMASRVCTDFDAALPRTHDALLSLPGVGNKTANVVLSELQLAPAFPVDTHVFRVSRRLGLAAGKNVEKVEEELCAGFPASDWPSLHHWLIFHGRRVCKAQRPLCTECRLLPLCPWGKEALDVALAPKRNGLNV